MCAPPAWKRLCFDVFGFIVVCGGCLKRVVFADRLGLIGFACSNSHLLIECAFRQRLQTSTLTVVPARLDQVPG